MKYINVDIDDTFRKHFANLKQVFLYITNSCNLRCTHCLYKPWLKQNDHMDYRVVISLLKTFKKMGALKLSLLGGEPTLYGEPGEYKISDVISEAKKMGYEYIRLVINGQFKNGLLEDNNFALLNELTFSFDAITQHIHDSIRGRGTFEKALKNLSDAIELQYTTNITMTVHNTNFYNNKYYGESLDKMILWSIKKGVKRINFHPILKMEIDRDSWVNNTFINYNEWCKAYDTIKSKIDNNEYLIPVRIPQRFIDETTFKSNPEYFSYCPVKMGERIEIHPNGQLQICALLKGTTYSIAQYKYDGEIITIDWTKEKNEITSFNFKNTHPCAVIQKKYENMQPLCISFKPSQKEIIWNNLKIE